MIGGLVGETILIAFVSSGTTEKALSAVCTLLIGFGVWIEVVAGEAIEAKEKAAAKLKLAELNSRAAMANQKAAEAGAEQARIIKMLSGRRITAEQHQILVSALKGQPMEIAILQTGDPEAAVFAHDIRLTFQAAGIKTKHGILYGGDPAWGLVLSAPSDEFPGAAPVNEAFAMAGIPVAKGRPEPRTGPGLALTVGSRPPAF